MIYRLVNPLVKEPTNRPHGQDLGRARNGLQLPIDERCKIVFMDQVNLWLTVLGTLASAGGLLFGWSQAVRTRHLRRRIIADIWKLMASAQAVRNEMESSEAYKHGDPQIRQCYGKIVEQYRELLKTAILEENDFSETTIQKWRTSGRLMNDWEAGQARKHLPTVKIEDGTHIISKASGTP
jgi:hypothetical protein